MIRTLPNGLRVLPLRHGATPLVEARLHLPRPCRDRAGLAASTLLATCLSQRDDDVEMSAAADVHQITVTAYGPGLAAVTSALAQAARGTAPAEPGPARAQLAAQLTMVRAHPDVMVREWLARHLFGDHPATLQVRPEDLGPLPSRPFDPRGATLVIAGRDDPAALADAAGAAFAAWHPSASSRTPPAPLPALPAVDGGRIAALPLPGAPQSRIRLRAPAVPPEHPRYPALFLALNVLGGYLSSRLSASLREDKGYVYGVTTFFDTAHGGALLAVEADTAAATTGAALAALAAELRRMRTHPPTVEEIRSARAYALGSMATRLAPRAAIASALIDMAAKGRDPLLVLDFPRRLEAVPAPQVVAAAQEFFAPERFSGLLAADPAALPHHLAL
ncbi:insulinase family protein [Nonomuraea sp. MCN248]|uniref:Insulinase family protein n=1 Tax=Nonomuraea corallina TaxID=2989783 RepID=A0ABT4SEG6_9ACTN|nr:insulinase family protein [Nonomuraea corallina]MDA0635545.1 insulinase family protein [Nonomuraea corallina]